MLSQNLFLRSLPDCFGFPYANHIHCVFALRRVSNKFDLLHIPLVGVMHGSTLCTCTCSSVSLNISFHADTVCFLPYSIECSLESLMPSCREHHGCTIGRLAEGSQERWGLLLSQTLLYVCTVNKALYQLP